MLTGERDRSLAWLASVEPLSRCVCECGTVYTPIIRGGIDISSIVYQINREIRDRDVRVVSETGEQLGVMPVRAALDIAQNRELDLVKVQPNASPPVCKLMDYGKFKFEQSKKEKEFKKNQHITETKEIRLSATIGSADFDRHVKTGRGFLADGNRLKLGIRFRGRQMAHTDIGRELLRKFAASCEDISTIASESKLDGRQMTMLLAPKAQATVKSAKPAAPADSRSEAPAAKPAAPADSKHATPHQEGK
ncbi:MAG: translation initiation factor IF-3 [Oscillospiraceae bacterium]|nr:translation initiation factor IF-3 [Oscillospiraceae bacterium]